MWPFSSRDCLLDPPTDIFFLGCGKCESCRGRVQRTIATARFRNTYFGKNEDSPSPSSPVFALLILVAALLLLSFIRALCLGKVGEPTSLLA